MSLCPPYIVVIGATGSGKSKLAMDLARILPGEIIGCDSIQLYKGVDIGSAKPSLGDREEVPHHLVDVLDPHESYDAWLYRTEARRIVKEVYSRGNIPIVVGGTGLYLRALIGDSFQPLPGDAKLKEEISREETPELYKKLQQLNPTRATELHPHDRYRIIRALEIFYLQETRSQNQQTVEEEDIWSPLFTIMLDPPRNKLHSQIAARTKALLEQGLIEETQALLKKGVSPTSKVLQSIGYKQVVMMENGEIPLDNLSQKITEATRQYAKRQLTWFKKNQVDHRIHGSYNTNELASIIKTKLSRL